MSKLIAVAVAALFAISVNSFAQAPKAPEKAATPAAATSTPAAKSETKAPEAKGPAKSETKGSAKAEAVKK